MPTLFVFQPQEVETLEDLKICCQRFLKPFKLKTMANKNDYHLNKGAKRDFLLNARNDGLLLDKKYVVPNFLRKYNCHINLEIFITINIVKYLFKYSYKDNDRTTVTLEDQNNENKCYLLN